MQRAGTAQARVGAARACGNQLRVAVDIRADLHDRRIAVAAGERREIGLRHDERDQHRSPGKTLVAEHQPDLLGVRRPLVVMENDFAHLRLLQRAPRLSGRFRTSPRSSSWPAGVVVLACVPAAAVGSGPGFCRGFAIDWPSPRMLADGISCARNRRQPEDPASGRSRFGTCRHSTNPWRG